MNLFRLQVVKISYTQKTLQVMRDQTKLDKVPTCLISNATFKLNRFQVVNVAWKKLEFLHKHVRKIFWPVQFDESYQREFQFVLNYRFEAIFINEEVEKEITESIW